MDSGRPDPHPDDRSGAGEGRPESSASAGASGDDGAAAAPRGSRRSRLLRSRLLWAALAGVLLLAGVERFALEPFEVPTSSMAPGLRPGDRIVVDKTAYLAGGRPARGDVVVFDGTELFGGGDVVKRVVGVAGDRVRCCGADGRITVNGEPLDERGYLHPGDRPSEEEFSVTVPEGRLWLLGDHRSRSRDSRDHLGSPGGGMVPVDRVVGRVAWRVWPLGRAGSVS